MVESMKAVRFRFVFRIKNFRWIGIYVYDSTNPAMNFSQKILLQDTLKIYG